MPIEAFLCLACAHAARADRLPSRCFRCGSRDVRTLRVDAEGCGISVSLEGGDPREDGPADETAAD